ncbi:MAG: DNA-directed RNA polymerase subunit omega [Oscillospiraceae bacterium]|nr:DNA-directed RNA polymerase subunit omega [Oscillospiraceae bacterium]
MFNPDLKDVLSNGVNRYQLVKAVAKRAREISLDAEENKEILSEKSVSIALDEIITGKYDLSEADSVE